MNLQSTLAKWSCAFALLAGAAGTAHATGASVNCTNPGDLQTAINSLSSGSTLNLTVTGTCTSTGSPFSINTNGVLIDGGGSAIIEDQIFVSANGVTIKNSIINGGAGKASTANVGVVVGPGASAILSANNINTWTEGVDVDQGARASIAGGQIDTGSTTGSGIHIFAGATVGIGYVPSNTGLNAPVLITSNGTGVEVDANASVLILQPNIQSNHLAGLSVNSNAAVTIVTGTGGLIEDNTGDGIDIQDGGSVVFNSTMFGASASATQISGNHAGIVMSGGTLDIDTANITTNTGDGIDATAGANISIFGGSVTANSAGGINTTGSTLKLRNVTISGNSAAPPIESVFSMFDIKGSTISAPGSLGLPAILAYRSSANLTATTVNGPTNSNTLGAYGGTSALLYQVTLDDNDSTDATLLIADGSTVVSAGGNLIQNASGTTPTAITVTNGSTFHEETNPVLVKIFTPLADTITGNATVQMQSNMELGTGGSVPSTWTGSITVAQNSSFRMDGGMTITGSVTLSQGSNGFFNKTAGGNNLVNAHVTCNGTDSVHVVGGGSVNPAVTMVTSGSGCWAF